MIASSLTRFAARKGWPKDESFLIHGEWNGCPVTLVDGEGFIEVVFSLPGFAENGSAWDSPVSYTHLTLPTIYSV